MEHLRLLGVSDDGSRLLLEGTDGTPYGLPLDERVHAAMRGDRARLGQLQIELENQLTPREIQSRIRAGQTAEEIAIASQVPVERIRRFEGPVLQERWYIADLAQRTNVRRVTDSAAHQLDALVLERLGARGVEPDDLAWDARRREDGRWAVRLDYVHGGRERSATWLFDHQRRTLEPHDDEADWLIGDERAVPEPKRGSRGRSQKASTAPAGPAASENDPASDDPDDSDAPEFPPASPGAPRLTAVPDVVDDGAIDGDIDVADASDTDVSDTTLSTTTLSTTTLSTTDDDVDAPPIEAPADDADDHGAVVDGTDSMDDSEPESPPEAEKDSPLRPTTGRSPKRAGRRASVPSWDEILFGGSSGPED